MTKKRMFVAAVFLLACSAPEKGVEQATGGSGGTGGTGAAPNGGGTAGAGGATGGTSAVGGTAGTSAGGVAGATGGAPSGGGRASGGGGTPSGGGAPSGGGGGSSGGGTGGVGGATGGAGGSGGVGCNPVDPTNANGWKPCTAAQTCVPGFKSGDLAWCASSGNKPTGTSCTVDENCAPKNGCEPPGVCRRWCFSTNDCPSGVCNPNNPPSAYAGTTKVGFCT